MTDSQLLEETQVRADLAKLLLAAVEASGRTRCAIAAHAEIHRDALRRILSGGREASVGEALRILSACGTPPRTHMILYLASSGDHATAWLHSDLASFFDELVCELPTALERVLGNQLHDVKPRWAKGTAHRVARLLADHIDELERKDALFEDVFASGREPAHA